LSGRGGRAGPAPQWHPQRRRTQGHTTRSLGRVYFRARSLSSPDRRPRGSVSQPTAKPVVGSDALSRSDAGADVNRGPTPEGGPQLDAARDGPSDSTNAWKVWNMRYRPPSNPPPGAGPGPRRGPKGQRRRRRGSPAGPCGRRLGGRPDDTREPPCLYSPPPSRCCSPSDMLALATSGKCAEQEAGWRGDGCPATWLSNPQKKEAPLQCTYPTILHTPE